MTDHQGGAWEQGLASAIGQYWGGRLVMGTLPPPLPLAAAVADAEPEPEGEVVHMGSKFVVAEKIAEHMEMGQGLPEAVGQLTVARGTAAACLAVRLDWEHTD